METLVRVVGTGAPAPAYTVAPVQKGTAQGAGRTPSNRTPYLTSHSIVVCLAMLALAVMVVFSGCSVWKHSKPQSQAAAPAAQGGDGTQASAGAEPDAGGEGAEAPAAEAPPSSAAVTVHIGYAHRDDYVASMTVAKFASAALIPTRARKDGSALVRFEGGEPVWQIAADRGVSGSLLGHVPGVAEYKKFAIKEVTYGVLPKNFAKQEPENSEPEPLERGKYYIFTVNFGSGSVSYQAAHVTAEGAIEDYEAQPRIGTSFELCCNVAPDFAGPASSGPDSGEDQSRAPSFRAVPRNLARSTLSKHLSRCPTKFVAAGIAGILHCSSLRSDGYAPQTAPHDAAQCPFGGWPIAQAGQPVA